MTEGQDSRNQGWWSRLWKRPRSRWLLGIPFGGLLAFIVGVAVFGGFNVALHSFDTIKFCTSCHEMQVNFDEYAKTIHYQNQYGVRAVCSDCHDAKEWFPLLQDRVRATFDDIPNHIMGTIDTPAKYEAHRAKMAMAVWARMKANNSRNCRSCHSYEAMKAAAQSHSAAKHHSKRWRDRTGETCIDCHFGIAHDLPKGVTPADVGKKKEG